MFARSARISKALQRTFQRRSHVGVYAPGEQPLMRATTILSVRRGNDVVVIGDGQVSFGDTVLKPNAKKVRRMAEGKVICGIAGATADAFTLLERLEGKLEEYPGQLMRASVEMAKLWRTEKYLRHLQAHVIAVDKDVSLTLTGNGDVIEPHDGVIGIGSGSLYAIAAARALIDQPDMELEDIAKKAMTIAADLCVYTNHNFVIEKMIAGEENESEAKSK